ncbi:P-loop containing nucleoside triphosphate hydrolase protein [Daedalea quercina L-15889]|uniref:p-loop containing nucleoside triphosphate hydrolase protein n=1 Tax=Daedalea quercina L-15889 TaxID=1314783 RepID=A0A165NF78_9APHY|nr:P-loop containing nucleoside triphosphate hydrolase protein [Daedalea quercina L-15889]
MNSQAYKLRGPPIGLSLVYPHLPSSSALHGGTKLLITGGIVEAYRRLFLFLVRSIVDRFCITVSFDEEDPMYNWLLYWLSRRPVWRKARDLEVTTRHYGLEASQSAHPWLPPREDTRDTGREMSYLPRADKTYHMWYKRHLMLVSRRMKSPVSSFNRSEYLHIRIIAFSHRVLGDLLEEARAEYKTAKENVISVWASNNLNNWINITSNPKRAIQTIILDPGVKEMLLEDAHEFLNSQPWYAARGIPFRRGYLLYGAPGSGKSSLIQSIAGELGLDVYIITLSRSGLDDNSLYELIGGLPKRCIALMEDIDAAFKQGITRDLPPHNVPKGEEDGVAASMPPLIPEPSHFDPRVTLSGLLNALDGIGAQEGRILFATTNNFSALDPALRRPGRMDVHVEFKLASKYQAGELFKCFYMPSGGDGRDNMNDIEKECSEELAVQFSGIIPDRRLSMASLQGYLMRYKELGGKDEEHVEVEASR